MANNKQSQGISRRHLMQLTGAGVLATGLGAKLIAPNEASASEVANGGEIPGHISRLVEAIKPALAEVQGQGGDKLDNAVRANIKMVVRQIKSNHPILAELVQQGKLKVVGGRYDLDNGAIEMIA